MEHEREPLFVGVPAVSLNLNHTAGFRLDI